MKISYPSGVLLTLICLPATTAWHRLNTWKKAQEHLQEAIESGKKVARKACASTLKRLD